MALAEPRYRLNALERRSCFPVACNFDESKLRGNTLILDSSATDAATPKRASGQSYGRNICASGTIVFSAVGQFRRNQASSGGYLA